MNIITGKSKYYNYIINLFLNHLFIDGKNHSVHNLEK